MSLTSPSPTAPPSPSPAAPPSAPPAPGRYVPGPIQRAYLVGAQDGLELSGPARYHLACDLDLARVPGLGHRLRELVTTEAVLRVAAAPGLALTTLPPSVAEQVDVPVHDVADDAFEAADAAVRAGLTAYDHAFPEWPQLEVVVVRSPRRARLHLAYALWLMDADSLARFLRRLVAGTASLDAAAGAPAAPVRDRTARDERFWRARAAGLPGPAELPLRPGWRASGPAMGHRTVTLDAATAGRLEAAAARHGLTVPMACLAAYGAVLGRLGGGAAHTVTVLHSRRPPGAGGPLGNHGTTMPLEVPGTAGRPFADLAREVRARYLAQAMHASIGGAEIARLAATGTDPRRLAHPFAFTAFDADSAGEAALGLRRRWDEVQLRVPQVLIDHQVARESDGRLRLGFDWRADAFDPGFAEDFVARCTGFLRALAETGTGAGADAAWTAPTAWTAPAARNPAALATPPVRDPLARPVPAPGTTPAPADTLHGRVLRAAAATPAAPAVLDADGTLDYATLVAHARAVAAALTAAGAATGDRVAVHLPRGRGQVVGILGALLAGCVYVPLDYGVPDGRLDNIARRGALRFALVTADAGAAGAAERWERRGVRALPLPEAPASAPADAAGDPYEAHADAAPTAYVIFTSGSTGEPKGVVVSHAAVLGTVDAVNDELGLGAGDRVLSVSSIGFDLSVWDVFGPLARGGAVVMLGENTARDPAAWARLIGEHGVTVWNSAPALASLLAEEGVPAPGLRAFLLSGDWIPLTLPPALGALAPGARVISLGGATEGAVWSIAHPVAAADLAGRSIPYGRALRGQRVLVLDEAGGPCGDWEIGELHLAGGGVADGYAGDPERTAAAFLDHPVHGWTYRTGDRGRRLPGGTLEFLGRTDTQVKLNGHRVELGEIEHQLSRVPGVRRAAVCVRGEGARRRPAGYVTLEPGTPPGWREAAWAALRDALPRYMVPDTIVALDEIPLTANGKVDRARLATLPDPDPDSAPSVSQTGARIGVQARATAQAAEAPPTGGLRAHEVALCWREVLGTAPGDADFFASGGGSYDAIRLLSLLRTRYGHDVPFGDFMADPTVGGLAARCGRRGGTAPASGVWTHRPRPSAAPGLRLVLFPPVGGGVSCYTALIREFAADVDVHVLGLDTPAASANGDGVPDTLPALARACLDALPAGTLTGAVPLVFAGWSFGGALAYEAARAAEADGTPVARVVVVDTPVSAAARDADGGVGDSGSADRTVSADQTGTADGPGLDAFLTDVRETTGAPVDAAQAATDPALTARYQVYRRNLALLRAWRPRPGGQRLVELRAATRPAEPDPGAWAGIARVEETAELTGGHFDVFHGANLRRVTDAIEETDR